MSADDNTIDLVRLLRILEKLETEGREALDPDELPYFERGQEFMRQVGGRWRASWKEREAMNTLGQELYEALPAELRQRWAHLTPAQLGTLALAYPDTIPPEARHLLEE